MTAQFRKEIQEANTWHFKGTLGIDAQDIVPTTLFTLLKWILSGVVSELKTEQRAEDVNRKVTSPCAADYVPNLD